MEREGETFDVWDMSAGHVNLFIMGHGPVEGRERERKKRERERLICLDIKALL
jgi:hypothetical protein